MKILLARLGREEDGHHLIVYALWVGAATAIVEPYLILAAAYRMGDLFLLLQSQLQSFSW